MASVILTGCVKWFNHNLNYGFITVLTEGEHHNSDIFVHQSNIKTKNDCYRTLSPGECVQFEIAKSDNTKHPINAVNVTGFNGCMLNCEVSRVRNFNYEDSRGGARGGRGARGARGGRGGRGGRGAYGAARGGSDSNNQLNDNQEYRFNNNGENKKNNGQYYRNTNTNFNRQSNISHNNTESNNIESDTIDSVVITSSDTNLEPLVPEPTPTTIAPAPTPAPTTIEPTTIAPTPTPAPAPTPAPTPAPASTSKSRGRGRKVMS